MFIYSEYYDKSVRCEWENIKAGRPFKRGVLRREIEQQWEQYVEKGIGQESIPFYVSNEELKSRRQNNRLLCDIAQPFMESLYSVLPGPSSLVTLLDSDGVLILLICHDDNYYLRKISYQCGAKINLPISGYPEIDICARTKKPAWCVSEENYLEFNKGWTGCTAPILDEKGQILAYFSIADKAEQVHPHTLGMTILAARSISDSWQNAGKKTIPEREACRSRDRNSLYVFEDIIGRSKAIMDAVKYAKIASRSTSTVLITGESGTGKELFAQSIHSASDRADGPFIAINCGALPTGLVESELFGYEDGAFTGAKKGGQVGLFEQANHGTIFLDEIGEMPMSMQTTLLRVLESREIIRIGGKRMRKVDVRIIAATNRNLTESVNNGSFRGDLFYRLNVLTIEIPALRKRKEDIVPLTEFFLSRFMKGMNKTGIRISPGGYQVFCDYQYPGNVRELENIIERSVNILESNTLIDEAFALSMMPKLSVSEDHLKRRDFQSCKYDMNELEKSMIVKSLTENGGCISDTARAMGTSRKSVYKKCKRFGIEYWKYRST